MRPWTFTETYEAANGFKMAEFFHRDKERQRRGIGEMGQGFDSGQEWRGSKDRRKESTVSILVTILVVILDISIDLPAYTDGVSVKSQLQGQGGRNKGPNGNKMGWHVKWGDQGEKLEVGVHLWSKRRNGTVFGAMVPYLAQCLCTVPQSNTYNSIQNRSKVTRALALVPWRLTRCCGAHYSA
ncbi:hypothetical protein Scep_012195 [Stephania cephalantha]|uniref:Uncharacterized protein n=1 Tax=Stephania cephalantha TaxID=152367 RepID=A0AAP0P694_9MAGN